ncbi:MAG TPA: hypothetical protein VNG90_03015 [Candidatus Acidoferrum sp.]|nr:hypothetical protein [Candidatus Acidoferrum sp.]
MRRATKIKVSVGVLAVVGIVATALVPSPSSYGGGAFAFRFDLAFSTLYAVFYFSAALIFFLGLKDFTPQLRRAYTFVAAGITLLAASWIQVVVLGALNLLSNLVLAVVAVGLSYILAGVLIYVGARQFSQLLHISSRIQSPFLVITIAIVAAILSTQLPHVHGSLDEATLASLNAVSSWIGTFLLASALLALKVKQKIGPLYTRAMAWLVLGMLFGVLEISSTIVYYISGLDSRPVVNNIILYGLIDAAITAAGFCYVASALAFIKTKEEL